MPAQRSVSFLAFGVGTIANGVFSVLPAVMLMYYMTSVLGIGVAAAGMAVFIPKLVDVVTDPLIGIWSDRTRSRWGRRRPFLLAGAVLGGPTMALLFAGPPAATPGLAFAAVLGAYVACAVAYTLFMIPYVTLTSELARDYHERTTINAYRMTFSMLGVLLGGSLPPLLVKLGGGGIAGYRLMGMAMGALVMASMFVSVAAAREPPRYDNHPPAELMTQLWGILQNRPFLILLVCYLLLIIGAGTSAAALPYYVTSVLGRDTDLVSAAFVASFGTALVSVPLWNLAGRFTGKLVAFALGAVATGAAGVVLFMLPGDEPLPVFLAVVAVTGIGNGAQQVFAFSMLADTLMEHPDTRARQDQALLSGTFVSAEKMGFAIGALLASVTLSLAGLVEAVGDAVQPAGAVTGIRIAFGLVPAFMACLSLACMRLYATFERRVRTAAGTGEA